MLSFTLVNNDHSLTTNPQLVNNHKMVTNGSKTYLKDKQEMSLHKHQGQGGATVTLQVASLNPQIY